MFNYRKYYGEYYGIEVAEDFDIHHIDGDRNNNDISNLIMLPSKLHAKYHMTRSAADNFHTEISHENCGSWQVKMMKQFCEAMEEISKWVAYKESLDVQRGISKWLFSE